MSKYMTRTNEKIIPDWEELDAKYSYNAVTGELFTKTWTDGRLTLKPVNKYSDSIRFDALEGSFPVSRIIWKLYYHDDPPCNVKHVNGDKYDNSIKNLASPTMIKRMEIRKALRSTDYLPSGIKLNKKYKSYTVKTYFGGLRYYGGSFKCRTCAIFSLQALVARFR